MCLLARPFCLYLAHVECWVPSTVRPSVLGALEIVGAVPVSSWSIADMAVVGESVAAGSEEADVLANCDFLGRDACC